MKRQLFYYHAKENNPYKNLAIEEYFIKYIEHNNTEEIAILYLWSNQDCVVCGRNQNVAAECDLSKMAEMGIMPVRRKTGGGAVFHDLENLNFSFIVSKQIYNREASMNMLIDALFQCGICAKLNGRNDILVDNFKISGSAYSSNEYYALHHGTLLLKVNMEKLSQVLTVDPQKLASKGVRSVSSRVANLIDIAPEVTKEDYEEAIYQAFYRQYHVNEQKDNSEIKNYLITKEEEKEIEEIYQEYASIHWIFGHDKEQIIEKTKRFSWGSISVSKVKDIKRETFFQIYSDTLYTQEFEDIKKYLQNKKYMIQWDEIRKQMYEDITYYLGTDMT